MDTRYDFYYIIRNADMVQITDHRPFPDGFTQVGSCCTLLYATTIANEIDKQIKAMAAANARYAQH